MMRVNLVFLSNGIEQWITLINSLLLDDLCGRRSDAAFTVLRALIVLVRESLTCSKVPRESHPLNFWSQYQEWIVCFEVEKVDGSPYRLKKIQQREEKQIKKIFWQNKIYWDRQDQLENPLSDIIKTSCIIYLLQLSTHLMPLRTY